MYIPNNKIGLEIEFCKKMDIKIDSNKNFILIDITSGSITPYLGVKSCIFCGEEKNVIHFKNFYVCKTCIKQLERAKTTKTYYY